MSRLPATRNALMEIEHLIRYAPLAVGLMEIENSIRYASIAVGLMEIENLLDLIKIYFDFRNDFCVSVEFGSYAARNMFP